jgi:dTMP kinase
MPLITFEGIEGSGKSTQARRLADELGALFTFEPGATETGVRIREIVLGGGHVAPQAELLLFLADRAQHIAEVIRPALAAQRIVISDRYNDSTLAYQGYGRQLPLSPLRQLTEQATGGLRPELTLLLDVPVALGLARAGRRGAIDRIESETITFHERVRDGFRRLAEEEPARWVVLDGERDPDVIAQEIRAATRARGFVSDAVR